MPDSSPSTLDIITLVVAIVGVALACASLVWQTASFVLAGSRVRARLRRGAIRRDVGGETMRTSGPLKPSETDYEIMRAQGFTADVLIAEVRNVGRMAVSVERVRLDAEDGWGFEHLSDENTALPYRLEAGSMQSWHVALGPLQILVDQDGKARRAWMTVELGTGKSIRTKDKVRIGPGRQTGVGTDARRQEQH